MFARWPVRRCGADTLHGGKGSLQQVRVSFGQRVNLRRMGRKKLAGSGQGIGCCRHGINSCVHRQHNLRHVVAELLSIGGTLG